MIKKILITGGACAGKTTSIVVKSNSNFDEKINDVINAVKKIIK